MIYIDCDNPTEKQHYVPCCYLANFGKDGNKGRDSVIFALDVHNMKRKPIESKVETFAFENCFYDFQSTKFKRALESTFAIVEKQYGQLLDEILENAEKSIMTLDTKDKLAAQFAMQMVRTKYYRDARFKGPVIKYLQRNNSVSPNKKELKTHLQKAHLQDIVSLDSINGLTQLFRESTWVVFRNKTRVPFYTSDNPVCIVFEKHGTGQRAVSPNTHVYVAISPETSIGVFHESSLSFRQDRSVLAIADETIVDGFNQYLSYCCTRFVFSNTMDFSSYKLDGIVDWKTQN